MVLEKKILQQRWITLVTQANNPEALKLLEIKNPIFQTKDKNE